MSRLGIHMVVSAGLLFVYSFVLFIHTLQSLKPFLDLICFLSMFFSLCRTPEQVPSVVSLLSESYNPHVRYGAAMALGISCAGTGNKVINYINNNLSFILWPLYKNSSKAHDTFQNISVAVYFVPYIFLWFFLSILQIYLYL